MTIDLPVEWNEMSDDARVWIWASPTQLSNQEVEKISSHLSAFVSQWTSHQVALKAQAHVFYQHFVVVALDQSASTGASGCSIDSLTHEVQSLSQSLNLDLQDRQTFFFYQNDQVNTVKMSGMQEALSSKKIEQESLVFDTLVKTKLDLKQNWLKPANQSWHARFF